MKLGTAENIRKIIGQYCENKILRKYCLKYNEMLTTSFQHCTGNLC